MEVFAVKNERIVDRSAVLSSDGLHRFVLSRRWSDGMRALIIGLNPSTADHSVDDATVRKLYGFGDAKGFGSYDLLNLWSFRSTDPKGLKAAGYPVRPEDDDTLIAQLSQKPDLVICAWGSNARGLDRPVVVAATIRKMGYTPKAFRLSADGTPWHPLYVPYSEPLVNMP